MRSAIRLSRAGQHGFSLLEVLVAFTILALTLGVLMQIFSRAMSVTTISWGYDQAAVVAEGQLNRVGFEIPLVDGVYEGETAEGVAWTLRIAPYPLDPDTFGEPPLWPYRVVVDVLWQDGGGTVRHLSLPTLRLGEVE